mgnify:FL=1
MPLTRGPKAVTPAAGVVLAEIVFPYPQHVRLHVLIRSTYNVNAIFEVWDGAGKVLEDMVLQASAPSWYSPELGPFIVPANGRIRIVTMQTDVFPGRMEVQAYIQWRPWGER